MSSNWSLESMRKRSSLGSHSRRRPCEQPRLQLNGRRTAPPSLSRTRSGTAPSEIGQDSMGIGPPVASSSTVSITTRDPWQRGPVYATRSPSKPNVRCAGKPASPSRGGKTWPALPPARSVTALS
jgi:hypothetical protein